MREYYIRIPSIDFISIKSVSIIREINCHSRATIVGYIADDNAKEYTAMLLGEYWVDIEAVGGSGERKTLLKGIVTEFSIDHGAHQKELALTIHSGSYLMDISNQFRTFQNETISYDDVLSIIDERYAESFHIGAALGKQPIGDFLMQYQETDWDFIKRLASRLNYHICPNDVSSGVRYYFGLQEGAQIQFPENTKCSARKSIGEYMEKEKMNDMLLTENDCLEFIVSSRDIHGIWDWTYMMERGPLFIYKIESVYEKGELFHHYYMRTAGGLQIPRAYNMLISGCSFEALVKEIKNDHIRIDVQGDENLKQDVKKWFKYSTVYSTPDGTGWYCMPEIGDTVRLYIPNKRENDGYVASSVHMDVSSGDRSNPDNKSIMNKHRKEILFTPDKLVLTNNNGISIEIADGEGVNIISNKSVHIKAVDSVTVTSESGSMTVAGTDDVRISQGGASIKLDDDIIFTGGELRMQ